MIIKMTNVFIYVQYVNIWVFPKIGGFDPQNGWFISWKTLLKWMILGGFYHPYFWKHPYADHSNHPTCQTPPSTNSPLNHLQRISTRIQWQNPRNFYLKVLFVAVFLEKKIGAQKMAPNFSRERPLSSFGGIDSWHPDFVS